MIIDIEEVRKLLDRKNEINRCPLKEIQWRENGEILQIPDEILASWKFMGLSNIMFIELDYYKEDPANVLDVELGGTL